MKLSLNARNWVKESVRNAFAEEMKKANGAFDAEENRRKELLESFRTEANKVLVGAKKEIEKIVKRMKLTFHNDKCIDHLDIFASDSRYDIVDLDTFEETCEYSKKMNELRKHINKVETDILTAVSKALYEIEVHGKRDTLESIVAEVIKSIKEEK